MRFMRLGPVGEEIPVASVDGLYYDLRPLTEDINGDFLSEGSAVAAGRVDNALGQGELPLLENADRLRVGAPIARPTAVICIGQNYAAHAAESGSPPPEVPIIFFKHPNTVVGPYDEVVIPPGAETVDWEVELGIVIGKRARYLSSPDAAAEHIAGYVISNDVSERNYQLKQSGGQWSKGKCAETFNPVGPELVTAEEVEANNLRLFSRINGESRQDSNTSDMIFSVPEVVHHLSHYMVLEPGDLINTGTPQGVAISGKYDYLKPDDVMEIGIDGLGQPQRQELDEAVVHG
ncbi:fumarylacetoacetate hydrolase family protein [Nesterenkonia sp. MY13]|uniref:Fumarylacetoacetate hydrolase family protein n=1 Tax=Nesterenkonia sedimenti TaxID=1463632 RepID=A0A7X8TKY0_9MICC|nr:fumarylacetoacetate hydrolase family protein [Nesterenkonia sedimenti]NLS10692.1 fumarylacetoacetate hydrolase family protein [Nesterenkonia sedimenti]